MKKWNKKKWGVYLLEFLSVFIAVFAAFSLENWKDNQKDRKAEEKILIEIKNGLLSDLKDMEENRRGHKNGVNGSVYFKDYIFDKEIHKDTLLYYKNLITTNNLNIFNRSGYESLKSKGLELIENDSLRTKLISIYEYDYEVIRKFEEELSSVKFFEHFHDKLDSEITRLFFYYKSTGEMTVREDRPKLTEAKQQELIAYLSHIAYMRLIVFRRYDGIKENVKTAITAIDKELEKFK